MREMPTVQHASEEEAAIRVMVADDVKATRHSTCLMLKAMPNVRIVAVAENGEQAVEMGQVSRPDLAILDICMGKVSGIEVMTRLRAAIPQMRFIAISAEQDERTVQQAQAAGARDYLIKPFTMDELRASVAKTCAMNLSAQPRRMVNGQTGQLRNHRDLHLQQLAITFAKERRTDREAMEVLEELAANPYCEQRWLTSLAILYVLHSEWRKLAYLAARLERLAASES